MKKHFKAIVVYLLVLSSAVLLIYYGNRYINDKNTNRGIIFDREEELDTLVFAEITSIDEIIEDTANPQYKDILFTAKTFGDAESNDRNIIQGRQIINDTNNKSDPVANGDKVVVMSYGQEYLFQYFYRMDKIIILGLVIVGLIILMGGLKGINTVVSLSLTCLSIFMLFIPAIKAGYDIYASTILISLFIILVTIIIVYGISKKSLISILSCTAGVILSGALCVFMDKWMKLTGYINEDTYMLSSLFGIEVNVKALLFSMITIGAFGAIMDVSMSITSPLCELKEKNRNMNAGALMKSGLSIGRDFMGTMANTLILAYIGSSLIVVLVYASSNYPILSILNKEEIIFEFLQSLIGCLGLLFTIPFTTFIASLLLSGHDGTSQRKTMYRK